VWAPACGCEIESEDEVDSVRDDLNFAAGVCCAWVIKGVARIGDRLLMSFSSDVPTDDDVDDVDDDDISLVGVEVTASVTLTA
jgi:hypothetical protein